MGGNVGNPPMAFRGALEGLAEVGRVVAVSALYRSRPVGPTQPRYWNMAALLDLVSPLLGVLDFCQELEAAAGRDRGREVRWGPRPLDLDLLLADGVVCRGPRLELPHPRLLERSFALVPAAEVAPGWVVPASAHTLSELAARPAPDLERVGLL